MTGPRWKRHQHAVFTPADECSPAVLVAVAYERVCGPQPGINACRQEHWVIDCARSPGLPVRIGDEAAPWELRPPGRLHCYAPGCRYWEDYRPLAGRRVAGEYLIVRDRGGVLVALTGALGHARIDDGDGRLRGLLQDAFAAGTPGFWRALRRCGAAWLTPCWRRRRLHRDAGAAAAPRRPPSPPASRRCCAAIPPRRPIWRRWRAASASAPPRSATASAPRPASR